MCRGPPTKNRHHKRLRIKEGISKGVVYELSEPKRTTKCIPPPGLHWRCSSWLLWGWCADCGVRTCLNLSAFSKRALHSNVASSLVPSTFLKHFRGGKGLSLVRSLCKPWEALRNKKLAIQTCLRGWYQIRFFGFIFGHSWGIGGGRDQGGTWYGTSAKPKRHFTKGMFPKNLFGLFLTFRVISILQGYFGRPSENTL